MTKDRIQIRVSPKMYEKIMMKRNSDSEPDSKVGYRLLEMALSTSDVFDTMDAGMKTLSAAIDDLATRIKKLRESDLITREHEARVRRVLGDLLAPLRGYLEETSNAVTEALTQVGPLFQSIETISQRTLDKQEHLLKTLVQFSEGLQRLQNTILKGAKP